MKMVGPIASCRQTWISRCGENVVVVDDDD